MASVGVVSPRAETEDVSRDQKVTHLVTKVVSICLYT